jgi:TRAP-type C4-dicarboxylate transport system permease large subunit
LALSAVAGALVSGNGIPVRHLVEGSIAFLDPIIIVITAMVFMKVVEKTGALASINYAIINNMSRFPTLMIIFITFFVMMPGMLTGISSTCILTTGALVAPALIAMGMPRKAAGALISIAAVLGMIAPPINLPIMIIGGGVDMPYVGFEEPLILLTFPLAIITAIYFRVCYIRKFESAEVIKKLPPSLYGKHGIKLMIPLIIVIGLMAAVRVFSSYIPDLGIPLIFIIGIGAAYFTGEKFDLFQLAKEAVKESVPVLAILVGVGMFVQIMTLTGVRGFIAVNSIELPRAFLYIGIAVIMPAFGSAFASSSVLGVPLIYVFLGQNEILVACALSLIAGLGDLMPPPSLLPVFASKIVGVDNHYDILKKCIPLIIVSIAASLLVIIYANDIAAFIGLN